MKSNEPKIFFAFLILIYIIFLAIVFYGTHQSQAVNIATIISPLLALIGYFIIEIRSEERSIIDRSLYYRQTIENAISAVVLHYNVKEYNGQKTPQYLSGENALEMYCHWLRNGTPEHITDPLIRAEKFNPIIIVMNQLVHLFIKNESILNEEELLFYHRYFQLMGRMNDIYDFLKQERQSVYTGLDFDKLQGILKSIIERKESR